MFWFGIILLLIVALVVCLLATKVNIIIEYCGKRLTVTIRVWFIKYVYTHERIKELMLKKKKPPRVNPDKPVTGNGDEAQRKKPKEKADEFLDELDRIKDYTITLKGLALAAFRYIPDKVFISDIVVRSKFGTGDASQTGIIYGAVWALISEVYAVIACLFYIDFPDVELEPAFNETVFEVEAEGIIRIRIVHIITAVLRRFKEYFKHKQKER